MASAGTSQKTAADEASELDLYAVLGLTREASVEAIHAAWRAAARRWHPDLAGPGAVDRFVRVGEAYATLSDADRRAAYDRALDAAATAQLPQVRSPVRCTECGRPTAQPRVVSVRATLGLLVWSHVRRIEAIFCSVCARRAAARASVSSATLGWFSPVGPAVTLWCIGANALIDRQRHPADRRLALINAHAFLQRDDYRLAQALARQAAADPDRQIADQARAVLRQTEARRAGHAVAVLHDPWRPSWRDLSLHASLAAIPLALLVALTMWLIH